MSGFSTAEKRIAVFLSKHAGLKRRIKKIYSALNYLLNKKKYSFQTRLTIEKIVSDLSNESFFGYYDKSPLSPDGKYIIFHETDGIVSHLPPDRKSTVKIMLFDTEKNRFGQISKTSAYNWQQGSKLQWLNNNEIIFNDIENEHPVARIFDITGKSSRTVQNPIYDCFGHEYALSLSFERLNMIDPDYGYAGLQNRNIKDVRDDGIFYTDLKTGENRLILSLDEIIRLHPADGSKEEDHCVNHIMISPDGKNFIFIHRWFCSGTRLDSLVMCDIEGKFPRILANDRFVSHCCWQGNDVVTGFLQDPSHGKIFYRIDISTGLIRLVSEKLKDFGDGHPSFFGNKMLFDSYPDRSRMQHLYIYDMIKDKVENIGSFLSPLRFFGPTRCDLHPKWSSNGKNIFIDSVHEGNRNLYKLDLKEEDS